MTFTESAIIRVDDYLNQFSTHDLAEMMSDLVHYADRHGMDLQDILARGQMLAQAEAEFDKKPTREENHAA